MVKLHKLVTRTGDTGSTSLACGARVRKGSLRIAAIGEVDELNSALGICYGTVIKERNKELAALLLVIMNELFNVGAELAFSQLEDIPEARRFPAKKIEKIELVISSITAKLPELRSFILPGGTTVSGLLHFCRSVCRRAERAIVTLGESEPLNPHLNIFMNRLSDLLFALARLECKEKKVAELLWDSDREFTLSEPKRKKKKRAKNR